MEKISKKQRKEIEARYNQLASKKMPEGKDMVNCYRCHNCGNIIKTVNTEDGVTPFVIQCDKCNGEATSLMYIDVLPDEVATYEWYRPSLKFVLKTTTSVREHVLNGGLILRRINGE